MRQSGGAIERLPQCSIGFLPLNIRFNDNCTVTEIINFFSELKGVESHCSIKLTTELDLDKRANIRNLSPGQQRKLQLVIATVGKPEILVLDEPTAGLDPVGVQQVRELICEINKSGTTVFISSHILMELDHLCNRIAVIEKGTLLYQGDYNPAFEIEIEGGQEQASLKWPETYRNRCKLAGSKMTAYVGRQEIPDLLRTLHENDVRIYEVKQIGLEQFYNGLIKEVS
jgi:ABC-2 type transport system ATP-binding protein